MAKAMDNQAMVAKSTLKSDRKILHDTVNKDENEFECNTCYQSFALEDFLKEHIMSVHDKKKEHQCPHCLTYFALKDTLKRQLAMNTCSIGLHF